MRVPGGGASCLGVGRPGSGALPSPTARPLGGLPGPTTHWLWVRGGAGVRTRHQPHSARSCELALRAVGAARRRPGGAPPAWVWGVRGWALSHPRLPALWAGRWGPLPTGCGCGGMRAWGPVRNPTARALASWLCALWGRQEGAWGGRLLPGCGASGVGRSPTPGCSPSGRGAGAHYPLAVGAGGCGRGDPSTTPQRALLRAGLRPGGRHEGARGGRPLPGYGASGVGRTPTPESLPSGRAAGAHYPLVVGAVCGRGGPAVLGTLSRAAVRRVLCALPGFAAPGGRCGLAPVLVPWLWPAACLSVVPRGPALVRRSSSGPVALGALVGFPVAVVPSPTPGAVAPGFTGWLRGARGGRPRTRLFVPAAGSCRGKGAGRAPRRTRSGPRDGVVPGGSLRLRSRAACAAVVSRVWTRSLTRPVSRTVRLATGNSAGAPGLFRVDADTALFRSEDATPGSRACVRVRALLGRVGGPASRARFGAPHLSFGRSCFVLCLFGSLRAGVALFVVVVGFSFCFFSPSPPRCAPVVSCIACFPAPGALGLGVLFPPPLVFFSLPPLRAPRCLLLCVFSGLGCPGPWRLLAPPPLFFFFFFFPPSPPPSCFLWRFLLSGCLGPLSPPPFFFCPAAFFPAARLPCVFSGVVLCVPCSARSLCCARRLCCFWWLVLLVPGVAAFCWGSAGGSGCLTLSLGGVCRLWCRVWSGCPWASSLWCPVPLCCVLWRCAAVWCCAVVPCLLFLFFSLLVALVSCCSPLGSGPVLGRFCFSALPVRCCAGVPAPLLSVRCSLALAELAGVLCCCLLCLCVCCWVWLSSVVSWWVLVAPGVVSRWRAVVCPWVLCCAVLLRVVPPGVALLCAVLCRFAPFGAAVRRVVSWGAVRRLGVLCLLAPCFVLFPRAVCVLLWCVAAWCCSPLCFVPCAPWGVVLCVSCRLRPVRCCCVARSPSVPCSPVLCPVVLCCRVVPWCRAPPPCWVCFLRRCGCTYLKNHCTIS